MFWAGRIRQIELPLIFVHEPCPDRAFKRSNVTENFVTVASGEIRVEHNVAHLAAVALDALRHAVHESVFGVLDTGFDTHNQSGGRRAVRAMS